MTMQDPIADMLTRIRNAQAVAKRDVTMPYSNVKAAIAVVLEDQGFIASHSVEETNGKKGLVITLKYYEGKPVITMLKRVSKPGLRSYRGKSALPEVMGGLGVTIISTSKGLMTAKQARKLGLGGEVLCFVS